MVLPKARSGWSAARVGEIGAERVVDGGGEARQAEPVGDEGEGVAGGVVVPARQGGGECAGEGDGVGVGDQVACQECGGGAAVIVRWGLVA